MSVKRYEYHNFLQLKNQPYFLDIQLNDVSYFRMTFHEIK